jgi:hypothetical protein
MKDIGKRTLVLICQWCKAMKVGDNEWVKREDTTYESLFKKYYEQARHVLCPEDNNKTERDCYMVFEKKKENTIFNELSEIAFRTKDGFITPVVIGYLNLGREGLTSEDAIKILNKRYLPTKNLDKIL